MGGTRHSLTGRRGIPYSSSQRIVRLLEANWPKASIAREVGVSRMTVYRHHWGEHYSQRGGRREKRCTCGALLEPGQGCLTCDLANGGRSQPTGG